MRQIKNIKDLKRYINELTNNNSALNKTERLLFLIKYKDNNKEKSEIICIYKANKLDTEKTCFSYSGIHDNSFTDYLKYCVDVKKKKRLANKLNIKVLNEYLDDAWIDVKDNPHYVIDLQSDVCKLTESYRDLHVKYITEQEALNILHISTEDEQIKEDGYFEWSESRGILMTEDKKCVLRGCDKYSQILTLVNEKTKYKIKQWRSSKNLERYVDFRRLLVSDKVKELYGLDNRCYNKEKMGKLISVKLEATYKIK